MNAKQQGMVVVERDGPSFLVMFPDGTVRGFPTKRAVTMAVKRWFKTDLRGAKVGIGTVEWRD